MIDKRTFKNAIAAPLDKAGFKKKGQSWYLDGKDAIIVVNLQKSDWSEIYFINMGIWLKNLGETSFPQYNHCHLYYRIERFFPEQRELILVGCSLDKSNQQMLDELSEFIESEVIPFLRNCTDENKLRELMLQGALEGGLVRLEARWYLSGE